MSFERVPLDSFKDAFSTAIGICHTPVVPFIDITDPYYRNAELSSVALGGSICSVSDEFFAEANHLLLVEVSTHPDQTALLCAYANPVSCSLRQA